MLQDEVWSVLTFVQSCLDVKGIIIRVLHNLSWEDEVPSSSEPLSPSTTGLLEPEDKDTMTLRNVGNYLPAATAEYRRRLEFSAAPL